MFQHHPSVTISPFASEIIFGAKLLYTIYGQSKMKSLSVQQFMFTITRTTSNRRHQLAAVHVHCAIAKAVNSMVLLLLLLLFVCLFACHNKITLLSYDIFVPCYVHQSNTNKASKKHVINNVSDFIQSH